MCDAMSNGGRVAIIAIHGVAEQKQGDTAQALAELLIANAPAGVSYAPGTRDELILKVPPVEPLHARGRMAGGVATSAMKQMKQSLASDFVRAGQTSSGGRRSLNATGNGLTPGADFTDYLLDKARQNNMPTDTYAASRIRLGRNANGNARGVDIYEMYWADLSRLSGKVPRILTELFTVLFRFSTLGRDTVQAAAAEFAGDKSWLWLSRFQTGLDWAYSRLLALLFLQMLMLALFLTPLGLLSDKADTVHAILSGVFGIAVLFGIAYFTKLKARFVIGLVAGVAIGGVSWSWASAQWFIGIAYLAVLSCIYDKWLCICAERFRMVRAVGWALWAFVLAALVVVAGFHQAETGLGMWVVTFTRFAYDLFVFIYLCFVWCSWLLYRSAFDNDGESFRAALRLLRHFVLFRDKAKDSVETLFEELWFHVLCSAWEEEVELDPVSFLEPFR